MAKISVEKIIVPKFWFSTITKISSTIQTVLFFTVFLTSLVPLGSKKVWAQTVLSCNITNENQEISNRAIASYDFVANSGIRNAVSSNTFITSLNSDFAQNIQVTNQGIQDAEGNLVSALSAIANNLIDKFQQQGLDEESAKAASLAAISQWAALPTEATSVEVVSAIRQSSSQQIAAEAINQISDTELLTTLAGLQAANLQALGLSEQEVEAASQSKITPQTESSLADQIRDTTQATVNQITNSEAQSKITEIQAQSEAELNNIRQDQQNTIEPGSLLRFRFRLDNQNEQSAQVQLPNIQTFKNNSITGSGQVTGVIYSLTESDPGTEKNVTDTVEDVSIPGNQSLDLEVQVEVQEISTDTISNIGINVQSNCGNEENQVQAFSILPVITPDGNGGELIDPRGEISGCAGELLADYQGFSVGLYDLDADDPTESEVSNITPLTTTELPDDPNNNVAEGIEPNIENSNPFFLTNSDEGKYSFLFDEEKGQLDQGRKYILVVDPGEDSIYDQRRIKITIGDRLERVVEYTATSLDGRPITAVGDQTSITGEIVLVNDAERVGLDLAVLDLSASVCDAQEISITKTGDRAAAEPGDIVIYRLAVRNLASVPLTNFQITDTLPVGFRLETNSVAAEVGSERVEVATSIQSDRLVNFSATDINIPAEEVLNLIYAAQVTSDALRGSGDNTAIVDAQRTDNNINVQAGPAIHSLQLEPGIIQDSGILIGRVFVDKNFDGEQQSGEPGVPNAVIYLENGNRIITDADGLFSVANVLPGNHTGILDFTSIPEYRLAPNLRFSEANSKSRLVRLEPGGLVRMNFGVTPTAAGKGSRSRRKSPSPSPNSRTDKTDE